MVTVGAIDVRVGTVRDESFPISSSPTASKGSFVAITDDAGRFRARIDGALGLLDEVYIKPAADDLAPDPAYRIRIFDEDVDGVPGRVLLNVTGQTEGPVVVDRVMNGSFVIEITGGGSFKEVSFSLWVV